ncbi:MAG: Serine-type D-Ala-D-Ala carboxypeptidase [Parcubacteria group bacterium GW2011_GWC2_45_7]|nr:MAG: Serine-type D-Ala-D-Ala carboxypeptidase [Parcubacteria group bacterium GW2011_GWC2_45_7]KKU72121.1 MAG: Serine-type D-Ala-D-Ala carboxypeptidase [Parcubacteria group bacterium GW2011_GWA2_47_26]
MFIKLAALFSAIVTALSTPAVTGPASNGLPAAPPAPALADVPQVSAVSLFLIDLTSSRIIAAKNANVPHAIASITKLMTAIVALETQPDWSQPVIFEKQDQRGGDINYLVPGEELSLREAWNLMLVASSNDAAAMLARSSFGSESKFVEEMNKKAQELGLKRTRFTDPTGLDAGNVSTAREVAALARIALTLPEIREASLQERFYLAPRGKIPRLVRSTNYLLRSLNLPGVRTFGGKTGHIEESGYNLVFAAGKGTSEMVGVVLGSASNEARFAEMSRLMQWGFAEAR